MQTQIKWQVDVGNNAVHFSVQRDLVLTPTNFSMGFEAIEVIYAQMLNARIKAREEAKHRVLKPT